MNKKSGLLVICATILVLSFVGTASATNWSVDGSGGGDFSVIQEAIINASADDMIIVHSGVYYEHVYVNKSVTLKGIDYPVVNANGSGSAITLDANGIGNTHYSIDLEKDECDLYPLMTPFENYISSEFETEVAATSNMETIAKTFINLLNESEFEKAHDFFNKDVAEALPVDKLNATWNGLIDHYGAFTGIVNISSREEKGFETVFVTCNVSKAFLDAKIVFDINEKIAGLFFFDQSTSTNPRNMWIMSHSRK